MRLEDERPVVLKLAAPGCADAARARLEREYGILQDLQVEGVVGALALHETAVGSVLELDDCGRFTLGAYAGSAMGVEAFLDLAQRLVAAVSNLHQAGVLHRDLTPWNVAYDPATGHLRLIDFDLASHIVGESRLVATRLEGTPGYFSPEQTGRMSVPIDHRSDLYSLGAILYTLLAGRPPFTTVGILEAVHATVARAPAGQLSLRPDLPPSLDALVMRLLSKMPEDRYQSAAGVLEDLLRVGEHLRAGSAATFVLGPDRRSSRFVLPERLYGRSGALQFLHEGLEQAYRGEPVALAVLGDAGVGKTVVVQELDRRLADAGGWLVSARFDQLRRSQPFAAMAGAIRELIRRVLAGGVDEVGLWRVRLHEALGENAGVVCDLVPDAGLVLGATTAPPALPLAEARHRQHRVIEAFFGAFHSPERPLVLFLDDLQWADQASLALVERLLRARHGAPPMLVLAWRTEDAAPAHLLQALLQRFPVEALPRITLRGLDEEAVSQMIVDATGCAPHDAADLARLVHRKTAGNPYFVRSFLETVHSRGLLRQESGGRWVWGLEEIDDAMLCSSGVDLLTCRLRALPGETQRVLSIAACIGQRFDVCTLAAVGGLSADGVAGALEPAVEGGLLDAEAPGVNAGGLGSASVSFRFAHERVREAAYEAMPIAERRRAHAEAGRFLLAGALGEPGEDLFTIVQQLNSGPEYLTDGEERIAVAQLNLRAAGRALAATDCEARLDYLESGIRLLPADAWEAHYALAFALYRDAADSALLCPGKTSAGGLLDAAMPHVATVLDRVDLQEIRVRDHLARNENPQALRCALTALGWLGVELPLKPNMAQIGLEVLRTRFALYGRTPERLRALPEATDPAALAIYGLLVVAAPAAYFASPHLLGMLICRLVRETLTRGVHARSAVGFMGYAMMRAAFFDDLGGAEMFGQFAHELLHRFEACRERLAVEVTWLSFIHSRTSPYGSLVGLFENTRRASLAAGDAERCGQCSLGIVAWSLHAGRPLWEVSEHVQRESEVCRKVGQLRPLRSVLVIGQMVANLRGTSAAPWCIDGDLVAREAFIESGERVQDLSSLASLHVREGVLALWFGKVEEAAHALACASPYLGSLAGLPDLEVYYWYDALVHLAQARQGGALSRRRVMKAVARLRLRTSECAANFEHRLRLLEAELASHERRDLDAVAAYDDAIRLAQGVGQLSEHAFALELAARHFARRGQNRSAAAYLVEARAVWFAWGALARGPSVDEFATELRGYGPRLLSTVATPCPEVPSAAPEDRAPVDSAEDALDLESMVKTARVISRALAPDELLRQLVAIVVENAGADGCLLAREQDGRLVPSARATGGGVTVEQEGCPPPLGGLACALPMMNVVLRTGETVIIDDCARDQRFFRGTKAHPGPGGVRTPRSAVAMPLMNASRLIGVLYLENTLVTGAFNAARMEVVSMLASQAAFAIENVQLYGKLRESVGALAVAKDAIAVREGALGVVAHDLRSPLAGIRLFANTILQQVPPQGRDQKHPMHMLLSTVHRMDRLVQDLLESARPEGSPIRTQRAPVPVLCVLSEAAESARPLAGRAGLEVVVEVAGQPPEVLADRARLLQVFDNLVGNAIKFSTRGGRITLRAVAGPGEVVFSVCDRGSGIRPEHLPHVFDRFWQGCPSDKRGTGLGLAIVKGILEAQEGRIWVESELGVGSAFHFAIPTVLGPSATVHPA